jgi:hypothetical protein
VQGTTAGKYASQRFSASCAFSRYREIDKEIKTNAVNLLD